jgi:integrase
MAKPYRRKDSKFWYIAPVIHGLQMPQSSKTTDYQEALDMLRRMEGKIVDGLITTQTNKILFKELSDMLKRDYKIKGRRSESDMISRLDKHVSPFLGELKASTINAVTISQYVERRLSDNAKPATINRELAAIKRAYSLAKKSDIVLNTPSIEMLPEDNVRQGYFNEDHFRSCLKFANPILKDALIVAYYTGWRIDSILHLEWVNVDSDVIRLRMNQTKNRKATTFPLGPFPELSEAIERRRESGKGLITPHVFHRKGERVISIRKAWEIARKKANVPGRLIHDLRRTAVRNLKKTGWSDTEIMNMVGLKTISMLLRYGITTEEDILTKANAMVARAAKKS